MSWWHWFLVHLSEQTGTSNSQSRAYNYWSGFGSVVPWSLGILAGVVTGIALHYHQHNCAHRPCRRLGRHTTLDGHKLCHKHLRVSPSLLELPEINEDHL